MFFAFGEKCALSMIEGQHLSGMTFTSSGEISGQLSERLSTGLRFGCPRTLVLSLDRAKSQLESLLRDSARAPSLLAITLQETQSFPLHYL